MPKEERPEQDSSEFLDDEQVFHGSEEEHEKDEDGQEYEFNEKNFYYDLECEECFVVIAIDSDDPFESFGPFETKKDAEEWINSNEEHFEGMHLVVVKCCPIEGHDEEKISEGNQLVIDESEDDSVSHYEVVNTQSGRVVGKYRNISRARNVVDKRDQEYGASVHRVAPIYIKRPSSEESGEQK